MVRNTSKQAGFTLIELLVVVVIIGILASVAIPNFMGAQDKAKNSGVQANAHNVQTGLEQYAVDFSGSYPGDVPAMITAGGYLSAYPKTPWGTQQDPAKAIGAAANMADVALGQPGATAPYGAGTMNPPASMVDFGAMGYWRSGAASEKYDLVGSGKKAQNSVCVIHVRNY